MAKKTVMIIEDDMLHMKLFHDLLEARGYEIIRCPDGDNALEMALGRKPDLVLLDIRLPFVSGFDIVKEFKNENELRDTPVIAVTAMADNFEEADYLVEGFDGFISKPITLPNFLLTVAELINPPSFPAQQIA